MGQGTRLWAYAITLMVVGCMAGAITYSWKGISIAGCQLPPGPDQFISSCGATRFGDYEHDAFWFGLEPAALANLKAADVIFTGSSRTMFAFSTDEVRSYFAGRGLRQFNLGFGYDDQQGFFAGLAVKHHLRPRVLVIGVDPYFTDRVSPPAAAAMHGWWEYGHALVKQAEVRLQPTLCDWRAFDCRPAAAIAFRSSADGYFLWRDLLMPDREIPRGHQTQSRDFQVNASLTALTARKFLKWIDMPAACVVMVPMPRAEIWPKPDPTERIAEAVGAMYIDVDTGDDLSFVDGNHLSYQSAKRFSAAFVRAFDQLPQQCLGEPAPADTVAGAKPPGKTLLLGGLAP